MSSGNPNKRSATPQNAGNGSHDRKKQRVPGVSEYQPQKPSLQLFAPTFQIPACHQAVLNESIGRIAAVLTDEYNGRLDAENRAEQFKELLLKANDEIRELESERKRLEKEIKEMKEEGAEKKDETKDLE